MVGPCGMVAAAAAAAAGGNAGKLVIAEYGWSSRITSQSISPPSLETRLRLFNLPGCSARLQPDPTQPAFTQATCATHFERSEVINHRLAPKAFGRAKLLPNLLVTSGPQKRHLFTITFFHYASKNYGHASHRHSFI